MWGASFREGSSCRHDLLVTSTVITTKLSRGVLYDCADGLHGPSSRYFQCVFDRLIQSSSTKSRLSRKFPTMPASPRRNVLVTGGCGYIGTHTIALLLQDDYDVTVVDNLSNSSEVSLERVADIVGLGSEERKQQIIFHNVDVCDEKAFRAVFEKSPKFHSCIHFAGLKVC